MSKIIRTNLPKTAPEFERMMICFTKGLGLPFRLEFDATMEKFLNMGNVYFQCDAQNGKSIKAACNAFLRSMINLQMVADL